MSLGRRPGCWGQEWPWSSGCPPGAHSNSPHRAMKMANTTVPSLSKRWVSWGEGHAGLVLSSPPTSPSNDAQLGKGGNKPGQPSRCMGGPGVTPRAANLSKGAGVREALVPGAVVAARAHEDLVGFADLLAGSAGTAGGLSPKAPPPPCPDPAPCPVRPAPPRPPDLAGVEQGEAAEEDDQADHCGRHQHVGVPAQPGEVQGHLLTEVVPVGTEAPLRAASRGAGQWRGGANHGGARRVD